MLAAATGTGGAKTRSAASGPATSAPFWDRSMFSA
jgi:hypothetical protein